MVAPVEKLLKRKLSSADELDSLRQSIISRRDPGLISISACGGTGCLGADSEEVFDALTREIEDQGLKMKIELKKTGCQGFCEQGPLLVIGPQKIFYGHVTPEDASEIISETALNDRVIERLLYVDPTTGEKIIHEDDIPFYRNQIRNIMGQNIEIDPTAIEDYIATGGYSALSQALFKMSPDEIIGEVKNSGLRGMGGAGFLTGRKWQSCRDAKSDTKYVICNANEGDPAAFVDRAILQANPHSILEGMIIGAYAVGSHLGYIYVNGEFSQAIANTGIAIEQAMDYGLLGENILGSGFGFTVTINRGGGAFVCGESSALMASLEGKTGEPRAKYIHATEKGLRDEPSLLNNVKTWANVPLIINKGGTWFSQLGTADSKGTMIFSLAGKINNTGLVEVPMGITLRKMIYDIGGGIPNGKKFKAVQTGGPSGGCLPEQFLDTPVDFDELTKLGSMMGSGGMIVLDEENCMVDIARYFIEFLKGESCGKCVPCREGLTRMSEILNNITRGKGTREDMDTLEDLSRILKDGALCALGTSAPTPILSTIRYFRDEYLAHIDEKKCPAGVCRDLIK